MSREEGKSLFFSVVIPVYNQARWIAKTLASALDQGREDFEVIVVDDGSTDDVARELSAFSDRVKLIRQENSGVAAARNRGIEEARGEWIAFLDGDDLWLPGHLDRLAAAINARPDAGLVYADALVIDENGNRKKPKRSTPPGPDPFVTILLANTITTSAAAVRRSGLAKTGTFFTRLKGPEDWDLWLRLAHQFPVVHVPEVSVLYRRQLTGLVHTRGLALREDNLLVIVRAAALRPELSGSMLRKARANCFRESAVRLLAGLETGLARKELVFSIKENPVSARSWALFLLSLGGRPTVRLGMAVERTRERA